MSERLQETVLLHSATIVRGLVRKYQIIQKSVEKQNRTMLTHPPLILDTIFFPIPSGIVFMRQQHMNDVPWPWSSPPKGDSAHTHTLR